MFRIDEIRAFDHIVLLVAAKPVLRSEGRGHANSVDCRQRIEAVGQIASDGGGMRDQGYPLALQRTPQRSASASSRSIAKLHSALTPSNSRDRTAAAWKSGLPGAKPVDQYWIAPSLLLNHGGHPDKDRVRKFIINLSTE